MIFAAVPSSPGHKSSVKMILRPETIVGNLRKRGFLRSYLHRTVSKLQALQRLSVQQFGDRQKYDGYLKFFKAIHDDVGLPSKIFTLILPEVEDLMDMDLDILNQNIPLIRQNFAHGSICDLRPLPALYSDMDKNSQSE